MFGGEFSEYLVKSEQWFSDDESRKLFSLCLRGFGIGSSRELYKSFTHLGILHLLVLSGSQVSHYSYALNRVLGLLRRLVRVKSTSLESSLYYRIAMLLGFVAFGNMVTWAPPVTRAIFLFLVTLVMPRWHVCGQMLMALILQTIIFPEHLGSLGFYLSWMSFFFLVFFDHIQVKGIFRLLLLCVFCQGIVIWVKDLPWPSGETWLVYIFSNLLIGFLFDRFLFPLSGWVLAFCFTSVFFDFFVIKDLWDTVFWVIVKLFEAVAMVSLVVIEGIQYIH